MRNTSERQVPDMRKKELIKRTERWDPENDIDLAGILITISAVTRRLAKMLLESQEEGEEDEPF